MKISTIVTAIALVASAATAPTKRASVPYVIDCSVDPSTITQPLSSNPFGYVTSFALAAQGTPFQPDLSVTLPPPVTPSYPGLTRTTGANGQSIATVVGVMEKFTWNGGATDPIEIEFLVSQKTALQLRALLQAGMHNLVITSFGYYIEAYDKNTRTWFSEAFPLNPVNLQGVFTNPTNPSLSVATVGQKLPGTAGVLAFQVSIKFAPVAAQASTLNFADTPTSRKSAVWG